MKKEESITPEINPGILQKKDNPNAIRRNLAMLDGVMERTSALHQNLLEYQLQVMLSNSNLSELAVTTIQQPLNRKTIFNRWQLEEFAKGSIAKCFGPEFSVLDQRKTPRIPNGRLLLIDRVIKISGQRKSLTSPASITSEFNVKKDAWFIQEKSGYEIPLSILMEIALQPCGILSAYLGTALIIPPENNIFRNLDGVIRIHSNPGLVGKTIVNNANLIKTTSSAGLFIQEYAFELSVDEQPFLSGQSTFGYFTQQVMEKQSGLDIGEKRTPLVQSLNCSDNSKLVLANLTQINHKLSLGGFFELLDEAGLNLDGGRYGKGVIVGSKKIKGNEWFFENHFYQDPVMPGSLGVEVLMQCLRAYAEELSAQSNTHIKRLEISGEKALRWKYRGQVLPGNQLTHFEVHIKEHNTSRDQSNLVADADFWVDGIRIYAIENIAVRFIEGKE